MHEQIESLVKCHAPHGTVLLILGNNLHPSFLTRYDVDNRGTVIWLNKEEKVCIHFVILCSPITSSLHPSWDFLGINNSIKACEQKECLSFLLPLKPI